MKTVKENNVAKTGTPKRDGSGKGRRANAGRGCGGRKKTGNGRAK